MKNYLFDRFHAMKYGYSSTGNGRRESFRYKPIPRMSNTLILPGFDDPDAIIASVDSGLLVQEDGRRPGRYGPRRFRLRDTGGVPDREGAGRPMVRNATMMGNGPKALKDIDMVGNDFGFGIGTCGKDGQGVPVADAQPTLRMPEIIVGGKGA